MLNNIKITKKNNDGSYDYGEMLFNSVDFYSGDHVYRTLELSPAEPGKSAKKLKFRITADKNGNSYEFIPEKEHSYILTCSQFKGLKFYLEDKNGIRYIPDKNGVISLLNVLASPVDIVLHLLVEQYTVTDFKKEVIMEDLSIEIWSME